MTRAPLHRLTLAIALAISMLSPGCATTRDFQAPKERITDRSAYTLTHRQMRIDAGLVGIGTPDLGVNVGLSYGLGDWFQVGFNAAHAGIGMLNLTTKFNIVDQPLWGLGLRVEGRWLRGDWLWMLNESTRDQLAGINIVDIPIGLIASFPLFQWMGLHLEFGYKHSEVFGDLNSDSAALEGTAGTRELYLEPTARFYLWKKVALVFGAHIPLWARAAVRASVEDLVEPDLIVGVNAAAWADVGYDVLDGYYGGLELQFGQYTFMQIYAVHGPVNEVIQSPVLPSINFYWRF